MNHFDPLDIHQMNHTSSQNHTPHHQSMQKSSAGKGIILGILAGGLTAAIVSGLILAGFWYYLQSTNQFNSLDAINGSVTQQISEAFDNITDSAINTQEDMVVRAVEQVQPAVVSIVISKDVPIIEQYYETDPFEDFFGGPFSFQIPQYRENGTEKQEIGGGSGFIVSADGMIVTNKHVVSDTEAEYAVFLNDGTKYDARVVARDPLNDIAVIKIEAQDLSYLEFGDSDALKAGQSVIAIGNALTEFDNSVSVGVVSGLARSIIAGDGFSQAEQLEDVIQTDAAINPGNSGGPLLNLQGQVIGVNVAVAQGSENIGFALPANAVKNVVQLVKDTGKIVRPYIGVRYIEVTPELAEANQMEVDHGALVQRGAQSGELAVMPGSPADKAGVQENDIILEVDGQTLDEDHSLAQAIARKSVGDTVHLKIWHDGEEREIDVELAELNNDSSNQDEEDSEPTE